MSDGPPIEVVLCRTGLGRHDPDLRDRIHEAGGVTAVVDCFDRCDACELWVLCRIDGTSTRFRSSAELVAAVVSLRTEP